MGAKGTVMSDKQIAQALREAISKCGWREITVQQRYDTIAQAQAEISWKAREPEIEEAHKAGIKEVVEFITQKADERIEVRTGRFLGWTVDKEALQAKLKEWLPVAGKPL